MVVTVLSVAGVLVGGCSSTPSLSPSSPRPSGSSESSAPTREADAPFPDPAALLQEASRTTRALHSAHLVLSVVGKVAETPVKALEADLTNDNGGAGASGAPGFSGTASETTERRPAAPDSESGVAAQKNRAAKGTGKIALLGSEVDFQFVVLGGTLYMALPGAAWVDYGPTSRPYSVTALLSPDDGLANVLDNFVDPKVEARETVGGYQAVRVTGKVTPVAVNKFMPQLGATDRMSSTVWIQESGDRHVLELSLEPSKGNAVQIAFSAWNKPVTVEKPPAG